LDFVRSGDDDLLWTPALVYVLRGLEVLLALYPFRASAEASKKGRENISNIQA
jgi:hypothetical protein